METNKFVIPVVERDFQIKSFGTGFMTQQIRTACGSCGGRGYTLIHKCYNCGGNGIKSNTHEISVKLPVGVDIFPAVQVPSPFRVKFEIIICKLRVWLTAV